MGSNGSHRGAPKAPTPPPIGIFRIGAEGAHWPFVMGPKVACGPMESLGPRGPFAGSDRSAPSAPDIRIFFLFCHFFLLFFWTKGLLSSFPYPGIVDLWSGAFGAHQLYKPVGGAL
uniref:Uncharacterized protein n=1 Tax=Placozoa sp. H17 HM-2017 TaxID=2017600 RepID=A0A7I6NEE5_9METZ|nr:hypothetical protein [Placozoa sp. H17 HM-2017]